jgi:hypothetical protein
MHGWSGVLDVGLMAAVFARHAIGGEEMKESIM